MRISGGDARGIKLRVPPGSRPASERVRQAVFSSIAARLPDARVLDLYCGSGAYGLEALSRGAAEAVFVDSDRSAVEACRANLAAAGFADSGHVRRISVERYLSGRASADGPFDLAFADPPYSARDQVERVLVGLAPVLGERGRVVFERRWRTEEPVEAGGFVVEADRRYGDTRVLTYRRVGEQ